MRKGTNNRIATSLLIKRTGLRELQWSVLRYANQWDPTGSLKKDSAEPTRQGVASRACIQMTVANGMLRRAGYVAMLCVVLLAGLFPLSSAAAEVQLRLLCGAGLRQPVDELIDVFQRDTGIQVRVEYGGSGRLLARYEATRIGDVYLPGSHFYIDKLAEKEQLASRHPIVLHTPVIAVNRKRADKVTRFSDLANPGVRVGLGDPQAMALGRTAEEILENSRMKTGILKNVVVRTATVKQLTLYVSRGEVDTAIIARADAFQNREQLAMLDIDAHWYTPDIVTAAVLKSTAHPREAEKLARFLSSSNGVKTFITYGFLPFGPKR